MRILVVAVLLAATGCSPLGPDTGGPRVAAGFYPLAYVAQRVGGAGVTVTNLTQPGAEPHDLELTIKETAEIARADVVVHEKGFQPAVDDGVAQNAEGTVLEVSGSRTSSRTPTSPASPTRTSGRTRCAWPTSPTRSPPTSPRPTPRTGRRTTPTRPRCAVTSPASTGTTAPAWRGASGTRSCPRTTRSATCPGTG